MAVTRGRTRIEVATSQRLDSTTSLGLLPSQISVSFITARRSCLTDDELQSVWVLTGFRWMRSPVGKLKPVHEARALEFP